jgi:hypothetical protein
MLLLHGHVASGLQLGEFFATSSMYESENS